MTMNPLSTAQLPKRGPHAFVRRRDRVAELATPHPGTPYVSTDPATAAIADREFEIEFLDAGVEAFAFTFG